MELAELLRETLQSQSSDLHLCVGLPPIFRTDGGLVRRAETEPLTPEIMADLADQVVPAGRKEEFREKGEVDFSHALEGMGRFRVNVYRQRGSVAIALRSIPAKVTPLKDLTLPVGVAETLTSLCQKPNGLVLLTGPTGSGKSTTLAGMIDYINNNRDCHIVTLEDPIEFLHSHKHSVVNQREIGEDTTSFARGLRAALRQDPDVILVGEMRDLETIQTALEAAETGHLVLSTLHTNGAPATVDRVIDVFPPDQQAQVRIQLAATLQGVITQRLFKRRDSRGRFAAAEVMVVTPAIRNLIRESKTHQILSVLQTNTKLGMRTMDSSVKELLERRIINEADWQAFQVEQAASNPHHAMGQAGVQYTGGGPGGMPGGTPRFQV